MNRREFIESAAGAALIASAGSLEALDRATLLPSRKRSMLQAKGLDIVEDGKPVRLRGVNLGGWMLIEDYMIGLPWTDWKIREQFRRVLGEQAYVAFFDAWNDSYITDADCKFLAKQGFTFVRLPFNYRLFESDLAPGEWLDSGFRLLDHAVEMCRKNGLWVLFDLHAAPGAQARDQNAGSAFGEAYFWNHKYFTDRMAGLWKEIARRYRGDTTVAGYNLLCEPVTDDVSLLNRVYAATIRAIREVDPDHLIALDSNRWAKDISSLHNMLFEDPQVIPVLHHYYQDDSHFARLSEYPGTVDGHVCDRKALEATLQGKHDQTRIPRPTMASEFGVVRGEGQPFEVQLAVTRDLVSIFEEKGWGWSMWCYKDVRQMGLVTPRSDTPWRQFIDSQQISGFFQRYKAMEKPFTEAVGKLLADTDIDIDTREQWAREIGRDFDVPGLDYVLRRLVGHSPAELAKMARSFGFDSCEVHTDQLDCLKPFLGKV